MEIEKIEERVRIFLETEYRKDALYRYPVLQSQLGDVAKFIYHDPENNPKARVFGTREDEISIYGEVMCHLIALMISRKIHVSDAFEAGIKRLETRDGYRKEKIEVPENAEILKGIPATTGIAKGIALVIPNPTVSIEKLENTLKDFERLESEEKILVVQHLSPGMVTVLRGKNFVGFVTDHGGANSHGAMIARELGIPCVCGTSIATKIICTGNKIAVDGDKGEVVFL